MSGASTYTGATTVSAGSLVAGANAPNAAAGPFGNATSAIVLGDAATTTNNSSQSLLTGGAFTIGRAVTIADHATTGTYTIGGSTATNSFFTGLVTANKDLTVFQVVGGRLTVTGGITSGNAGAKPETLRLRRHSVRGKNFKVLTQQEDGSFVELPVPQASTYVGSIAEDRDALAYVTFSAE